MNNLRQSLADSYNTCQAISSIASRYKSWISSYRSLGYADATIRIRSESSANTLLKSILGVAFNHSPIASSSLIIESNRLYQFLGFRLKSTPYIIGSHDERKAAISNGWGFFWAFPINEAVKQAAHNGFYLPLRLIYLIWAKKVSATKCLAITYEDTQPVGIFFSELSKYIPTFKHVCVQHGYFVSKLPNYFLDGNHSSTNFVWDKTQASLFCGPNSKHYVMGPPRDIPFALPLNNDNPKIILVGTGYHSSAPSVYYDFLRCYESIQTRLLKRHPDAKVVYRPHPSELQSSTFQSDKGLFHHIEYPHEESLQVRRSIYVGSVSSLLQEASLAGHIIGYIRHEQIPEPFFCRNFESEISDITSIAGAVSQILNANLLAKNPNDENIASPASSTLQSRFVCAINEAGLLDYI